MFKLSKHNYFLLIVTFDHFFFNWIIPIFFFIFRDYTEIISYDITNLPDWEIVSNLHLKKKHIALFKSETLNVWLGQESFKKF